MLCIVASTKYFALLRAGSNGLLILLIYGKGKVAIYRNVFTIMDPISVIALLASLTSLSKALTNGVNMIHSFLEDSKNIDNTIELLYRETKGLLETLGAIIIALSGPKIQNSSVVQDYGELWARLMTCIKECNVTADEINKELKSIEIKKFGLFTKGVRQYKLGLKEEKINGLRSQIRTHGQAVSSCLGAINLYAHDLAGVLYQMN